MLLISTTVVAIRISLDTVLYPKPDQGLDGIFTSQKCFWRGSSSSFRRCGLEHTALALC